MSYFRYRVRGIRRCLLNVRVDFWGINMDIKKAKHLSA